MKKRFLLPLLLFTFFFSNASFAQDSCALRISVLTCGVGEELYSSYGHSAVRIIDSCNATDIVYNYGTFNFGDPDFYMKFTKGKLLYYLNDEGFDDFMGLYVYDKRSVIEQVINVNQQDAALIAAFLQDNLKEANKYYKYDFLFDNCSTRIRDLFAKLFKDRIHFSQIISNDSVTFRTLLNHYERNVHWERVGINLLMSHVVDQKMKSYESMFLPDYLMKGFALATLDGNKLVGETKILLADGQFTQNKLNEPRLYLWLLTGIIFLCSFSKKMEIPLRFFDVLFFMLLGLLGCLMLFMWFGTEHKVCARNLNLLWAFPLHLIAAFMIPRNWKHTATYAKYTSWLLIGAVFYNLFADQKYIVEVTPVIILILLRLNHYSKQMKYLSFKKYA